MYAPTEISRRPVQLGIGILAAAAAIALLYFGRVFFITLTISVSIALMLEPAVVFFMRMRLPRGVASFVVCSIALVAIYFAGLGLYAQALAMSDDIPAYSARINQMVDGAAARIERFETALSATFLPRKAEQPLPDNKKKGKRPTVPEVPTIQEVHVQSEPPSFVRIAYDSFVSFYNVLLMASFVPFLVYFILSWWDQLRGRVLAVLGGDDVYSWAEAATGVAGMVRAYVIGNFFLGAFLSVASGVLFASVKLPYWVVIGPLSGFLSLAPYVGLPLAMIPPVLAALPETTDAKIYIFLVASVGLLHLFAMNLLYPRFVGARVHLNPLAVTVALMFWGTMWGGIGLLLAIPLTAGIKAVCDHVPGLEAYGSLLGD